MDKPRLLDLFCGAGGATKGYQRSGFYVVGVDIKPQQEHIKELEIQKEKLVVVNSGNAPGYKSGREKLKHRKMYRTA